MKIPKIGSLAQATEWLRGKPIDWTMIVLSRLALRSLPTMVDTDYNWLKFYAVSVFRANLVAWASINDQAFEFKGATELTDAALLEALRRAYDDNLAWYAIASATNALRYVGKDNSAHLFDWIEAKGVERNEVIETMIFDAGSIQDDCAWLMENQQMHAVAEMTGLSLWLERAPQKWWNLLAKLWPKLLDADPNYSVWIDWYERRIRGERAAFDIPGDNGRVEDKKILRRLAEATDEDFWGKGHEYVNATLKGWLDEARARVAPEIISAEDSGVFDISGTAEAELGPLPLPAQNTNALSFRANDEGRIAIAADALASQLRTNAGARDRHEEAVSEAQHALGRCQGNNAAARLTGLLTNYLAAAGENLESTKPSLLVQRGERLRQELARYQASDHMLPPVADDLLLDLKGWQSAHNMMVGLDPVLNAMDTVMLGPDRQPALIAPDDIREKAREADEADLLQHGVVEVLEEAADLAPAVPDPSDRHTIWSTEMMRNLMIETASVALNNPIKTGAIVVGFTGGGVVGGISIIGSIKAAEYLVNHKDWILARLGNTPTWQALIGKLTDWLEEVTPFDRK